MTTPFLSGHLMMHRSFFPMRLFIILRWIALIGQGITVCIVSFLFEYDMPLALVGGILLVSVLMNAILTIYGRKRLTSSQIPLYLVYDLGQLVALLFVTGGLNNPFCVLLIAPVVVAAGFLPAGHVLLLCGVSVAAIGVLATSPYPLPWNSEGLVYPGVLLFGIAIALITVIFFTVFYIWRVSCERDQLSRALSATQEALVKEQKNSSLGALAAAAAHELGSPLTTISVVAKELSQSSLTEDAAQDIDLIMNQTNRCRDILQDLSRNFAQEHHLPLSSLPITAILDVVTNRFDKEKIATINKKSNQNENEPILPLTSELIHGLGNIIQNACQFANQKVEITVSWTFDILDVLIQDDGVGYPVDLMPRLGEPYVSRRLDQEECHMGLGLFIAQTLLARHKAKLYFYNREGACCKITMPLNGE